MPTLVACLWRRVEATQLGRVPTHFGPAPRLGRPKSPRNQGALATSQVEMCPRTANSGQAVLERDERLGRFVRARLLEGWTPEQIAGWLERGEGRGPRPVSLEARPAFVHRPGPRGEKLGQ